VASYPRTTGECKRGRAGRKLFNTCHPGRL